MGFGQKGIRMTTTLTMTVRDHCRTYFLTHQRSPSRVHLRNEDKSWLRTELVRNVGLALPDEQITNYHHFEQLLIVWGASEISVS